MLPFEILRLKMSEIRARDAKGSVLFIRFFSGQKNRSAARQKPGGLLSEIVCKPKQPARAPKCSNLNPGCHYFYPNLSR
jgi:hypothetical protein